MPNIVQTPTDGLLSTTEVAQRLGVDRRTVTRMVPSRLAPAVQAPGRRGAYLFEPAAVEALAAERAGGAR